MRLTLYLACLIAFCAAEYEGQKLTDEERRHLIDIAKAVKRFKRNPFERQRSRDDPGRGGSDLREKEDEVEGFIEEESSKTQKKPTASVTAQPETTESPRPEPSSDSFQGEKEEYCKKYDEHFSFYCVGDTGRITAQLSKFCNAFRRACPDRIHSSKVLTPSSSSSSLTSWPSNPFEKKITTIPQRSAPRAAAPVSTEDDDVPAEEEIYYAELRKRHPCKPDCDPRIFPHCTTDCKCDYIYPTVQRFCNPPPLPLFLNTCRLWYNGCPKYENYHYASQFVYSKAEKGKILPGAPPAKAINPYNIPSPSASLAPIRRTRRDADEPLELVIPPDLPRPVALADLGAPPNENLPQESKLSLEKSRDLLHTYRRNLNAAKTKKKLRRRRHRTQFSETPERKAPTTKRPPTRKELYNALKAINDLTIEPAKLTKDPARLLSNANEALFGQEPSAVKPEAAEVTGDSGEQESSSQEEGDSHAAAESANSRKIRPRALQGTIPVIPSDAVYGAATGDDPFKAVSALSDSRGIVHRPKSRSPFSKPGLWEPNPDNPHNRDLANKWYYHPESVGVDWLNGQVQYGAHWAVPAAGVGGTAGFSAVHFPTIGTFLNIPDDYD
ncbi:unnamed protein product [Caenorhabditis auriculariae]|uniref:Uncharacterized protein n=1 Tax=Caenorhabditis auriculariae TaxID=2777116 RepID=A0A8S1H5H4_9PELO|nr:unnamed protein product [Caenorhabditis auriculariae]